VPPNIAGLLSHIAPAVARARKANPGVEEATLAAAAVRENVWQSVFDLIRSSGPVREQLREGRLTIVGAVCDVTTGRVEWLGEHPWQEELVSAFDARQAKHAAAEHTDTSTATAETIDEHGH
jgi:carbonic anhydrase